MNYSRFFFAKLSTISVKKNKLIFFADFCTCCVHRLHFLILSTNVLKQHFKIANTYKKLFERLYEV